MEAGVTSSMGAMGPVLRKLDLLLAPPESRLRKQVKDGIRLLKEDLEEVSSALVDLSMLETPSLRAKCWMQEARELSYHIEDFIDDIMPMRGDADAKIRSVCSHRVGRVKISQLMDRPKRSTRIAKIAQLRTLVWQASERLERYQLDDCCRTHMITRHKRAPALHGDASNLVGVEDLRSKLIAVLTVEAEQQLKVVSIVGPAGVGKTTLAKQMFSELRGQFELRAFVRASRNLEMRRLLGSILSQVRRQHQLHSVAGPVQSLIDSIKEQLQDKRYLIIIDDLWEETSWDIVSGAFPEVNNGSRIVATTEIMNVALRCCSYKPNNILKMKPLGIQDSADLFFSRVFGSEKECPDELKEVSYSITRKCGGLPLSLISLAGLLSSQVDYSELWYHIRDRLCSILNRSHTVEETQKKILNFSYNSLPHCLKTCLLYFNMYPEGYIVWKVHLVKQWIAEGFINTTEGKDREEIAESYFDDLINWGMIQPMKIDYNGEVLSCTVHHIILDLITHNSKEEGFIAAIDYSQNITGLYTKAVRQSFRFSSAKYAKQPEGMTMSQLRSIGFFGLLKCMPPIVEFKHLRVLILDFWGTHDAHTSLNLSRICILFQLRYLKISSDVMVELPAQMQGMHYLETLDIDARVTAIPLDIVHLPSMLHLGLRDAIKLPDGIGRLKSLTTLRYFDLICNSEDNIWSLGKLTNLGGLHLTCSAALSSEHLKRKLIPLVSSLGKLGNLKSLTLTPDALRTAVFFDISGSICSPAIFLQRLELLPPICLFSRLPTQIGALHNLRILKIVVEELQENDINNIAGLPSLTILSLYVRTSMTGTVIFSNMAFPALKYFKFTCSVMCLDFQAGTMPNLQRLKLCFNAHKGENHSRVLDGIEHLLNLQEVTGRIGEPPGGDGSDSRVVKLSFEDTIRKHPRCPIFSLKLVDLIEEEYSPLDKLHRREHEGLSGEHEIIEEDYAEDTNKHVDGRGSMENLWQGMDNASKPIGEVNYTLGIDIGEPYVATEQQLNNIPPDGSQNMNTAMPAQPRAPKARKKGTAKRSKNFSIKEDEFLCSAWINVSKDPIVGINQPIRSYWARIKAYCDEHSKIDRSNSALQHRWADIQKDTSRFCGFYSEIERKNKSGQSENDKVKDAIQMYEGIVGSTFKFIHCWYILRNEMKWNEWLAYEEPSVEPVEANPDPTLPPRIARPVGRDKAKKARSSTSSSFSPSLEVLQHLEVLQQKMSMDRSGKKRRLKNEFASKLAIQEEQLKIQKVQVQLQQEMLQLQKEDREERVMTMNVDQMERVMTMNVDQVAQLVRDYINKQKMISAMSFRDDGSSGPSRQ